MSTTIKQGLEFCCMGHETYFTEDFQSDDDDGMLSLDFKTSYSLSFMPEPYEDIQKELRISQFHSETGTQCEFKPTITMSTLSSMPSISCTNDKIITPNPTVFALTHTARASFPAILNSNHQCKTCGMFFKNSQALGGHLSRKH